MERPPVDTQALLRHLADRYGLGGSLQALAGERDRNFLLTTADDRFVVKVCNPDTSTAQVNLQHDAMQAVNTSATVTAPSPYPAIDGASITVSHTPSRSQVVHVLSYLPGRCVADVKPMTVPLLRNLGRTAREIPASLGTHGVAGPDGFLWDVRTAAEVVQHHLDHITDLETQTLVWSSVETASDLIARHGDGLAVGAIHGDLNDANVLVADDRLGVIDFGDIHTSFLIAEVAVAAAYATIRMQDPVGGVAELAAGANRQERLTEVETAVLVPLVMLRLALSIAIGAAQSAADPTNEYLSVSRADAISSLGRLRKTPLALAEARVRSACGYPPIVASDVVVAWIEQNQGTFSSPLSLEIREETVCRLDWSVASAEADHPDSGVTAEETTVRTLDVMRKAGATVGLGRWGEPRLVYNTADYDVASDDGPRSRTVHCGVDLSCPAGTPVLAVRAGSVARIDDEAVDGGYGPVVTLRHVVDDGTPFWSLYGHLGPSGSDLEVGDVLAAGDQIGVVGAPPGNGNWSPHLHFQLMTDLMGIDGPFPGVAAPDEWHIWKEICPSPADVLGLPHDVVDAAVLDEEALLATRRRSLPPSLSTSYDSPVVAVRGFGSYVYDTWGRRFLDTANNVAHVGHGHPHVAAAIGRQALMLNTNSRYPHPERIRYIQRLAELFPDPLDTVFLVNSGSEANDLALRIARTATGRQGLLVAEHGYHGTTSALIEASHYKHAGPGGTGTPQHVTVVPLPDVYRSPAVDYVTAATDVVEAAQPFAAGLFESIPGVAGQIMLPDGYLAALFDAIRKAGGVAIADEVQTGLGRIGPDMWAYRSQGAIPDIVTIGKPIGNGHPLGAVVTTRALADAFANGMEYFNTFGGNPVSCAAGNAVLDVMFHEALHSRARSTGERLVGQLRMLGEEFSIIGDVRGSGLFLGIELVDDDETKRPAGSQTAYVVERCRQLGVLLSADGPARNVLKLKPPLVFGDAEVELLVSTLRRVLAEDLAQPA